MDLRRHDPSSAALRQRKQIRLAVLRTQASSKNEEDDEECGINKSNMTPSVAKKLVKSSQHQSSSLLAKCHLGLVLIIFTMFVCIAALVYFSEEEEGMSVGAIMRVLGLWSSGNINYPGGNKEKRIEMEFVSTYPPRISYNHDVQELNNQMGLITKENYHIVKAIKRGIVLRNMLLGSNHRIRQRRKEKMDLKLNISDEETQASFLQDHGHECMTSLSSTSFENNNPMIQSIFPQIYTSYNRNLWLWCTLHSGYANGYIDHATTLLTEEEWLEHLINYRKNIAVVIKDSESLSMIQQLLAQRGDVETNDHLTVVNDGDDTINELSFIHPSLIILSPFRGYHRRRPGDAPHHDNATSAFTTKVMNFLLDNSVREVNKEEQQQSSLSTPFFFERKLYEFILSERDDWHLLEGHCFRANDSDDSKEKEYDNGGGIGQKRLARHCHFSANEMFGKENIGFCCDIMM
mmetsp:Transcript_51092/g.76565  ORF Transcript_51092/g.76565 Transcript_51092/m.76565 type:complete len:462 (+) Transcript_51092:35-1420(+)